MSLKILASLIILIAVVAHATKRQQRIAENREKEFWARERKANSVRKKPLDDLDYVKSPWISFPWMPFQTTKEPKNTVVSLLLCLHSRS